MMIKISPWSSPHGFLVAFAQMGLLLLLVSAPRTAAAAAVPSQSQFCDECTPKIYDITQPLTRKGVVIWDGGNRHSTVFDETESPETRLVFGNLTLRIHSGSHMDSQAHIRSYYNQTGSLRVDSQNLNTLMGPVLVVDTTSKGNITGQVLESLNLPAGLKRIIFRTENTEGRLKDSEWFVGNYTGFTEDGARWLVANTAIEFVGIDYLSIAAYDHIIPVHGLFLDRSITPVECLNLDEVRPGYYTVYCLPLKVRAEGAPVRCILVE